MSDYNNEQQPYQPYDDPPQPRIVLRVNRTQPYVTYTIIALDLLVYAAMLLCGRFFGWSQNAQLYYFGAKINELILYQHEYWRLFTCMLLHAGLVHLACNCFSTYVYGRLVEQLYGRWRLAVIYLTAGLAGSFLSFAFSPNASVGASGAIFGLISCMFYFRKKYKELFRRMFGIQFLAIIALNLFLGFTPGSGIDNFGHIGGIVGGLLAANAVGLLGEKVSGAKRALYIGLFILFCIACVLIRLKYAASLQV